MAKWYKAGTGITINHNTLTKTTDYSWKTAYGSQEIKSGKHHFCVGIICTPYNEIMIGITSNTAYLEDGAYNMSDNNGYMYFGVNGNIYDKETNKAYGETYTVGDEIGVYVDLDKQCLWFTKNGRNLGNAATNINNNVTYRLTVTLYNNSDSISCISYSGESDIIYFEKEEETKCDNINNNKYLERNKVLREQNDTLRSEMGIKTATINSMKEEDMAKCTAHKQEKRELKQQYDNVNQQIQGKVDNLQKEKREYMAANETLKQENIEFNDAEKELKMELLDVKDKYNKLFKRKLNESEYMEWDSDLCVDWIMTLDESYIKYDDKLRESFTGQGVDGSCIGELGKSDLYRFGIEQFKHQTSIYKEIQRLTAAPPAIYQNDGPNQAAYL